MGKKNEKESKETNKQRNWHLSGREIRERESKSQIKSSIWTSQCW